MTSRSISRRRAYVLDQLESRYLMAYVAVFVDAVTVGMVGDGAADDMTLSTDGVNLFHNRKTAGDPDYASNFDFDTTKSGEQLLPDALGNILSIQAGDGSDSLTVDGPAGAMSIKTQLAYRVRPEPTHSPSTTPPRPSDAPACWPWQTVW